MLGLDPGLAVSQYARKHWQVEEGLPQNYVTWLSQTADGYLIVGTAGGVARFDGIRFVPVSLDAGTRVSREWINVVQPGADGSLWIGSRDVGLMRQVRPGEPVRDRWPLGNVTHMIRLRDHSILTFGAFGLETRDGNGKGVRVIDASLRSSDPSWQGLAELQDGSFLVAASSGLFQGAPGSPLRRIANFGDGESPLALAAAGNAFWLGTTRGFYAAAGPGQPLSRIEGIPGPVVSIAEDRDGNVWVATWGRGLYRYTKATRKITNCSAGLTDEFVHMVFEDREGNLWIGSRAGLSRWSSGPVTPYGSDEGLAGNYFSTAIGDARGDMWFGTWRSGMYRMSPSGRFESIPLPVPSLNFLVRSMAVSPRDGSLWLSDWNGLYRGDGRQWTAVEPGPGISNIHIVEVDAAGEVWLGAANGLFRYRGPSQPVLPGRITALLAAGGLWAGTENGLWRVEANGNVRRIEGLPHPTVTSVQQDSKGRIWVTTKANGIVLISGDKVAAVLDARHGLAPQPFYAVVDDGRGSLWLSSPAGIHEVFTAQLDLFLSGAAQSVTSSVYDRDDGMRSIECQNVGRPSAWKDQRGDLWFPTVRGLVRIRPSARRANAVQPPVIEEVSFGPDGHFVRYTTPYLTSPGHVEFRYRLDDRDWVHTGASRELRYNLLSAGSHRLQVAARVNGGDWSKAAEAELVQPPHWYETWWFRGGAALAAAALLWVLYRWRFYLLRSRYRAILSERNRIAREWHDTLVAGFSAISWQLDTALKRLANQQSPEETIKLARTMVHHYRAEARRVVWDLRQNEPEIESLPQAVERALSDLTRDRSIRSEFQVEGAPGSMPVNGDLSQNLVRICQEAVSNAIQHAGASNILVRLRFEKDRVSALVRDDGCGFAPDRVPAGHFGLAIMQERARHLGGDVQIESTPEGGGTVILASLPYAGS